ncbi:MAG: alpha-amylase family glycosyl hydrolase [Erysipelotrichaceae bacterium]|nr:alpha-amylase family glycosyl hydrolase [Erysipelotrichaceae bacterium]
MKKYQSIVIALAMLSGCTNNNLLSSEESVSTEESNSIIEQGEVNVLDNTLNPIPASDNNRVFYEIFVGSFSDSNGDGIGDLRGIINRMDYLNDGDINSGKSLNVEGIWLSPIFKSPSYHKYDVTDYYQIDPTFGSEEDLVELINLCHKRNVKIIIDLPINHTSNSNLWFLKFSQAHKENNIESPFYDFYSYIENGEVVPNRKFASLSGTNHSYECNFTGDMPELNFDNGAVHEEVLNIAKHYLALGVDGFRFDAAMYIYYTDNMANSAFWNWYMEELRKIKSDIYTVAEVWASDSIVNMYYDSTDCFNFTMGQLNGKIAETAKEGNVNTFTRYVQSNLTDIEKKREGAMMISFITNHDMDRAAGFLTVASNRMKMAANLYLLTKGSSFIYYGEEIGMKGSRGGSASTDANRRLAMLWGDGDTIKNPIGSTYPSKNQTNGTVADQISDENSLYNYYKKLILVRRSFPEIASGTYQALTTTSEYVGGFISTLNDSSVCVLHNTSSSAKTFDLSTIDYHTLATYIGAEDASIDGNILTIGAKTSVILKK